MQHCFDFIFKYWCNFHSLRNVQIFHCCSLYSQADSIYSDQYDSDILQLNEHCYFPRIVRCAFKHIRAKMAKIEMVNGLNSVLSTRYEHFFSLNEHFYLIFSHRYFSSNFDLSAITSNTFNILLGSFFLQNFSNEMHILDMNKHLTKSKVYETEKNAKWKNWM